MSRVFYRLFRVRIFLKENTIMNELTTFNNPDFGDIRTLTVNGEPWFIGKDVAEILGYSNSRKAIADHVDEEDKKDGVTIRDSIGREQKPVLINESGLYSLILSSKLPTAKKFKHWVTSEVLPAIRRTGAYNSGYSTAYSAEEVRDIIMQEATRMLININARLGLKREEKSKKDTSKIGNLSPEDRQRAESIIKSNSYTEAAYQIRTVIGLPIGATAVRTYAIKHGLR